MSGPTATSRDETPFYFPAGEETLFGVLTRPTSVATGTGVILIYGGAYNTTAHVNQMWLRTARAVASVGHHVLRYDYHGIGDSSGTTAGFDHRSPHADDLRAAIAVMRDLGMERLLLVGDCLGARASLVCAAESEEVSALLMLVPMVRDATKGKDEEWAAEYGVTHYVRRAMQPKTWKRLVDPAVRRSYKRIARAKVREIRSRRPEGVSGETDASGGGDEWVSQMFLDLIGRAVEKGTPIDILFGSKDSERRGEFDAATSGRLGTILDAAGEHLKIREVEGSVAGITDLDAQREIVDYVTRWAVSPRTASKAG